MNWILLSLLMFFSSVVLYLSIRKSSILKVPTQLNNLAMFLFPLPAYILLGIITGQNFSITVLQGLIILTAAFFFSYLGNLFSLVSIERAPNPGYSLVISKSYVVFTTIVAVFIFQAQLNVQKAMAILLIVLFSSLISTSQKTIKKETNQSWLLLAIGSFFCWGLLSITSKYLFSQGMNTYVFLSYLDGIVSFLIVLEALLKKTSFAQAKSNPVILLLIGVFSTFFNLFMFEAIKTAPNIGYVNATNAASISLVTIFAILLFKDEFSLKKLIGVLGVTFGLILLLI